MVLSQASGSAGYDAVRRRSAVVDRSDRAFILLSGKDRATYLQGLLTNDITAIRPGEGSYAAYLTAQGRMITDLTVYELGDVMLVALPRDVKDAVLAKFDQFIFSEDVQLGDVTETFACVAVAGPEAAATLAFVLDDVAPERLQHLPEHGNVRLAFRGQPAIVLRTSDIGEAGFDVLVDRAQKDNLLEAIAAVGVVAIDSSVADAVRIEAGVPKFHRDMDEETIPLEAGIESRAISLTKGCYVGQEVVIRILHRGHGRVVRKLVGLSIDGNRVPAAGAVIQAEGRDIGRVTSSAFSPALERPIALGYVHRDFVSAGPVVSIDGAAATVTDLPFVK